MDPEEELNSQPIIKAKSLELIAKEIGDIDSGSNLVEFLTNCGIKREFIEYPNTKWRMVYAVLLTLASSQDKEDRRALFKIIEGACHPLMYNGDKDLAKKTAEKFNSFLEYDDFWITNGVLWKVEGEDLSGNVFIYDKDGNQFEPHCYLIFSEKTDELYIYWNELIKLTKFYFNNKDGQEDEINTLYFEIVANVEKLLNSEGCGGLKDIYKKPFRNIMGCEFEIQKQGLTADGLFVNLYDFLGKITELSLPDKNNIEKVKKGKSEFFIKIKRYYEQHSTKKELKISESPIQKVEIVKMPPVKTVDSNEEVLVKNNRRITLPKFPRTEWPKVSVRFLSDRDILLSDSKETKPADFASLGFNDERTGKPDVSWEFLLEIGKNNGESETIPKGERGTIKKRKQKITDTLRKIFKNQSEPFDDFFKTKKYKALFQIIPPPVNVETDPIYRD